MELHFASGDLRVARYKGKASGVGFTEKFLPVDSTEQAYDVFSQQWRDLTKAGFKRVQFEDIKPVHGCCSEVLYKVNCHI